MSDQVEKIKALPPRPKLEGEAWEAAKARRDAVAASLGETDIVAIRCVGFLLSRLGEAAVASLVAETEAVEAAGGLYYNASPEEQDRMRASGYAVLPLTSRVEPNADGAEPTIMHKRTRGGVFFALVKQKVPSRFRSELRWFQHRQLVKEGRLQLHPAVVAALAKMQQSAPPAATVEPSFRGLRFPPPVALTPSKPKRVEPEIIITRRRPK
jgi:hypothetical protein